jgi:hypothetical protein
MAVSNPSRQENGTEGRMYSCPPNVNEALPEEYRRIAEALFPPEGYKPSTEEAALKEQQCFKAVLLIGLCYLTNF